MLNEFLMWMESIRFDGFEEQIITKATLNDPCDNQSARLDVDTANCIGQIVLWESGDFSAEIIDLDSEDLIYSYQGIMSESDDPSIVFKDFINALLSRLGT